MENASDAKSLSQARYSQYAAGYVASETHAKGADLDRLIVIAAPKPDWLVLDVATGGGHTALKFAPHVARVVASDLTPTMLAAARQHITPQEVHNVVFSAADAENLPFVSAVFDLVTCRIAPHHFPDCFRFVQESARVLKPGGTLLVQDHVLSNDEQTARYTDAFEMLRDPSHHRAFAQYEWEGMFQDAGLAIVHTEQVVKRHQLHPWATRQGCSPEVIQQLEVMLTQAPSPVKDWMLPQHLGATEASFVNRHLIIAGQKPVH